MPKDPTTEQNVSQLLAQVAARLPDKPALIFQNRQAQQSITFGELWRRASAFGGGLQRLGFQPGQRAILMVPMSIDLYVCLLAVIKVGGAAVFVDPWIPARQIAQFAAYAQPAAFIGIGKSHLLRWLHADLRSISISVTTGSCLLGLPARYRLSRLEAQAGQADPQPTHVDASATALITFTSGSSGVPKGANRTHGFLRAQHEALSHEFPYRDTDVDLPMFPVFALNNLVTGLTSVIPEMDFRAVDQVDGAVIADQIRKFGVTTITASPPLIDRVAQQLNREDRNQLRRILTGGAPVTDDQLSRWQQWLPQTELVVAYGSTEAEPVGHILAVDRLRLAGQGRGFCTGIPTQLIDHQVIPITQGRVELGNQTVASMALPPGAIGELVVSGKHVCRDYFRNPAATAENKLIDPDGKLWHRMGDTGYFDPEGRFWLVGRVHSTIRRGTGWIHPQLVEQVVEQAVPDLARAAVIGLPETGGDPRCVLVLSADFDSVQQQAAEAVIAAALADQQLTVDQIHWTKKPLPTDPRHRSKIDYGKLRTQLLACLTNQN